MNECPVLYIGLNLLLLIHSHGHWLQVGYRIYDKNKTELINTLMWSYIGSLSFLFLTYHLLRLLDTYAAKPLKIDPLCTFRSITMLSITQQTIDSPLTAHNAKITQGLGFYPTRVPKLPRGNLYDTFLTKWSNMPKVCLYQKGL